jgi:hypothetical protein
MRSRFSLLALLALALLGAAGAHADPKQFTFSYQFEPGERMQPRGGTTKGELGVNRYERVADFDFSAGDRYWQHTSDFWRDVRDAWKRVYAERDGFEYAQEVDGHAMFEPLFEYAEGLDTGGKYDARAAADVIRRTFSTYLR